MKQILFLAVLGLAIGAGGWAAYSLGLERWLRDEPEQAESRSRAAAPAADEPEGARAVVALGRLVPTGGVISVGAPVGDGLARLEVAEGDTVEAGQELGYLDSRPLRQLEVDAVERQLEEARARRAAEEALAEAQVRIARLAERQASGPHYEVEAQAQEVEVLRVNWQLARQDVQRLEGLDLVSDQELQRQRLLERKAQAEVAAAEALLQKMEDEAQMAIEQAEAERVAAEASSQQAIQAIPIASLEKQLALAREQLERTSVTAPKDGTVLTVATRAGEVIGQKPILQLADLTRMECVAEVYDTDLRYVHEGQPVRITSHALGGRDRARELRGRVRRIGQMIATPELRTLDPFAPADRHAVEVHIELTEESAREAANLVNLQVEVTFLPDES